MARQKSDQNSQEKERQISMLSVDYRQIQQRLQKLEGEYRQVQVLAKLCIYWLIHEYGICLFPKQKQESEKVIGLQSQLEQEQTKKTTLTSELSLQNSEVAHLKSKEVQLVKEVTQLRETKRRYEDEAIKTKNTHNNDMLQVS